ncbi:MAG: prealbumin-like fold domain-containing protein, partial [Coriobacteriales bacterium]|nr:prealbumin-like fold domain-containing protein [Coriobacteriales bacterium]
MNRITFTHTQPGSGRRIIGKALSLALSLLLIIGLVPAVALNRQEIPADQSGTPNAQAQAPSAQAPSAQTQIEGTGGDLDTPYQEDNNTSGSNEKTGEANVSDEPAIVVNPQGAAPIAPRAPYQSPNVLQVIPSTATTLLSGHSAIASFAITNNAPRGWVLAVPVPDPQNSGSYTVVLGSAYGIDTTHVGPLAQPLDEKFGPLQGRTDVLLIWGTATATYFSVKFTYPSGTTPSGTQLTLDAYLFEASYISGAPSGIVEANTAIAPTDLAGSPTPPLTFTWDTNEELSITKSVTAPTPDPAFSTLQTRTYSQVANPGAENTYTTSYRVNVATTGSDDYGRVWMDELHIRDNLAGYLNGTSQTPQSIVVKNSAGLVVASTTGQGSPIALNSNSTVFDIALPMAQGTAISGTYFDVDITWDKNAYTKTYFNNTYEAGVVTVDNTATLYSKPVFAQAPSPVDEASAAISLGWQQAAPVPAQLTVNKRLGVSGSIFAYTTALATAYERDYGNPSYNNGDTSCVEFTLTDANNAVLSKHLILGETNSAVTFGVAADGDFNATHDGLPPGTYTLAETGGTSANVPANPLSVYTIVVSVPNPTTGVSTISVAGPNNTAADFNSGTNTLNFINTATQTGRIKITARTQNRWSAPATYTPQAGAAFNLLDSSNNIIASGTSDASGNIIFEDVPTTGSYHLAEATPLGSDYLLDVANSTLTNIASSVDKLETYTVTYQRNEGSLYVGKYFKGPDGAQIPSNTVGAFEATFHLVYADGAKQGEELPNSSFTISGTSQTATILANKVFPQGSYYIVEDSIKVSGTTYSATSPDAPYSLITLADGVKVDIIAGAYDNVPYDANVTDGKNMVVTDGPTGGALLVNSATWSELAIDSRFFSDSGSSPLTYPDAFTITNRADSSISYDIPANSSNWINGVYRLLVPAGTYDVAVKNPSDTPNIKTIASLGNQAAQGTSDSVSIKVEPGSVALANAIVAINNGTGTTSISYDGCANTAVFVQAYVPSVSITKLRADTNTSLSGAGFTLYRLVGTEYVKTTITATSTTSTTNNVSFANLIAGTYVAVETSIPAGYYGTVDASVFKDSVTNGFFDHVSAATVDSIADLTKFVVQQSDYAQTAQTSLAKGNAITSSTNPDTMANKIVRNVPTYTINARALDAATGSEQGSNKTTNAVFQLYQNNATNTAPNWVLVGTATYKNSAAVIFTTEGTTPVALTPGDYKVVQSVSPQPAQNGGEYIITGETAYFTVDSNGKAGTTNWTLPGKADSSTAQISWSSLSTNASTKIVSVVFGQVKKPIIEFQKYGETNQLIGNKRVTAPIQGGTFKIYSYDNGDPDTGTKVYLAQDFVAQGSNKLGWLDIPALDPTKTYYLAETATPPYQTDVPEDEPTAVQYKKIKDIKFWFELNSAKTAWEPHVFGADSGGFSSEVSSLGTGKYKIVNHVDPYFIHITKLPIKPTTDGTITPNSDEFTIDAKSGERDADGNPRWQEILVANARFALYLLDENGNKIDSDLSKDGIQPIQYISSATGGEHSQNDAWSMQLPPGTYWVEEIASALNYGQIGTPLDPTETSSVYFNETASGMGEANGGDPTVPDWHAIIKGDKGYGVQITIPDLSANEDIDDEDRTYELFLGNSNRLDTGRAGINPPTWIQVHAWKNGASRLPYGGTTPYKMKYDEDKNTWVEDVTNDAGRLANVRFSLYPALFIGDPDNVAEIQDISNYIQLPTFNNTPLDDLRSSRWGSMDSQWINVTSVFRGIVSGLDDSLTITSDAVSSEDTDTSRVDWTSFFSNGQNSQYKQQAAALAEGNPENGWAVVWLENPSSLPPVFQTEVSSTPFVAHASVVFGTYGLIDQKYDTVNKNAYGSNVNHESPDTAKTPEIVNTRGIATLQVDKVELGNANNKVAGATFALYRADNSAIEAIYAAHPGAWNASGVNGVAAVKAGFTPVPDGNGGYTGLTYIDTLTTGADGTIAHSGLKPGYYYLVETTSGSNALNTYGEYSINYPERKVPEVTGPNVLPADVSAAAYGMGSAGSPTLIGPIELSDLNFPSFRVVAQGKPKPSIYVRNYWNGNLLYDSDYTATYKLTPAVDQANSYTATSANAETIQCLADGTYTLTLDRLSDTAAAYYGCNADAQDNKISLTITGAQISAVKIANQSAPLIADGNIWLTGAVWNSAKGYYEPETAGAQITLNVNQPAQGALIIRKGGLVDGVLKNYTGTTGPSAVPTNLNKA